MRVLTARRLKVAFAVACLAVGVALPARAGEDHRGVEFFQPEADPFGREYEEWASRYMVWLQEIPTPDNPYVNPLSPANCDPHGKAVFLAPAGADCTIPDGKPVFLSTFGHECSTAEGNGRTFRELRECAREGFRFFWGRDVFQQKLYVDGRRQLRLRRWRFLTPGEIVVLPEDNIWGAPAGPTKSVTKGLFYMIRLSPGRHLIEIRAEHEEFGPIEFDYRLDVRR